ncbi:MAG: fumarylacetoacetate hydrolase family protein [Tatlockia sp.]|jgi:fumarylacetoacetate (FAA) hydrolase
MKLASLKSANRDGELCVVSRDLATAVSAIPIAKTLQEALDNWDRVEGQLQEVYDALNAGKIAGVFPFDSHKATAPLPRAYQWADGSAYVNHVELVRKARNAAMPADYWTTPLMYQGGSDSFLGPHDDITVADEAYGIDFESEIAIITDDVPMGIDKMKASSHIKLLLLVNDVSLRNLVLTEIVRGFGFFQSKPASSFSPVAITPDELGADWDGERVHLPLLSHVNGALFGEPNAGVDMTFSFTDLIQHAAKTRHLSAGTIIGSGTVSNKDHSKGSSCIVEKRILELLAKGAAETPYLQFGDTVRIEMQRADGQSCFGAIEQTVTPYRGA